MLHALFVTAVQPVPLKQVIEQILGVKRKHFAPTVELEYPAAI